MADREMRYRREDLNLDGMLISEAIVNLQKLAEKFGDVDPRINIGIKYSWGDPEAYTEILYQSPTTDAEIRADIREKDRKIASERKQLRDLKLKYGEV